VGKKPWKLHGRKTPYTERGIKKLPCFRCGNPAAHQWQICSDGRLFRPVCVSCDFGLNMLVLNFMRDPDMDAKIKKYSDILKKAPNAQ
jgi:hypothetical protein